MNKLVLSGILALSAAASFAQNVATASQNGTSQTATANQSGSALSSTISQVGTTLNNTNNDGFSMQNGTGHISVTNQNNGSTFNRAATTQRNAMGTTGANSATISQSNGAGGTSRQTGIPGTAVGTEGNWAGVSQEGSGNKVTINSDGAGTKANFAETWQKGQTNTATTNQNAGATLNITQIYQGDERRGGGPAAGPTNIEVVGNTALVEQSSGTRNETTVKQFSNGNTADVNQMGNPATPGSVSGNTAFVQQGETGAASAVAGGNNALIRQTGALTQGNSATALQNGTTSTAQISQENGSSNNVGFIQQISGGGSDARIRQIGNSQGNKGTIIQAGNGQAGLIEQGASNTNEATILQGVADLVSNNNRAYISQVTGAVSNSATIKQNQTTGGAYAFNRAFVNQTGNTGNTTLNMAMISQEDTYNQAGLTQTGAGSNTATFAQTGSYNVIGGPGAGNGFTNVASSAVQDGFKNTMTVTQTSTGAMASASLNNTASLSQTGNMNVLTVNQTIGAGALGGNLATATQTGMNNQAIVQQTAMP